MEDFYDAPQTELIYFSTKDTLSTSDGIDNGIGGDGDEDNGWD